MVGRSVGPRGVGRRRALSDGGLRTEGSFYFFLEMPNSNRYKYYQKIKHSIRLELVGLLFK